MYFTDEHNTISDIYLKKFDKKNTHLFDVSIFQSIATHGKIVLNVSYWKELHVFERA